MPGMEFPTITDVYSAKRIISRYLPRTPLINYPALDQVTGTRLLVKHENHQPVGAFKVRGGVNLISRLTDDERARGVIGASTGNHGQSIAFASRLFGVKAQIVVPEKANPLKVAAMRNLGAEVIFHGRDFDQSRERAEELSREFGLRYIHSGDEPDLIAGVGTIALEMLEDAPEIDVIVVPVGGGSGASAASIVAKSLNPKIRVIGVQAEKAPAAYKSWKAHALLEDKMETGAEGLATRVAFELPQRIMWDLLDDFILVSEEEITSAVRLYVEAAHTLAEGAGAAPLAGVLKMADQLAGKTVGVILSGGNITVEQLSAALNARR